MSFKRFGKISENRVEIFQRENKLTLPNDYIRFLKCFNGGIIKQTKGIVIPEINEIIYPDVLYGIDLFEDCFNLEYWLHQYNSELPYNSLIIGDDQMKGFFVLICSGADKGLYYGDDSRCLSESSDTGNVYFLSTGFGLFESYIETD